MAVPRPVLEAEEDEEEYLRKVWSAMRCVSSESSSGTWWIDVVEEEEEEEEDDEAEGFAMEFMVWKWKWKSKRVEFVNVEFDGIMSFFRGRVGTE